MREKKEIAKKKNDFKKSVRTEFEVISEFREPLDDFEVLVETSHWSEERKNRHKKIVEELGEGKFIATFIVETGHRNGRELHSIFSNGIILIQNENTRFLVTELIARPQQLKRYWEDLGKGIPIEVYALLGKSYFNQRKGRNRW